MKVAVLIPRIERVYADHHADLAAAADKLDAVKNGHNLGHIRLFDGLSDKQNWKAK